MFTKLPIFEKVLIQINSIFKYIFIYYELVTFYVQEIFKKILGKIKI